MRSRQQDSGPDGQGAEQGGDLFFASGEIGGTFVEKGAVAG